jgi:hypothetical protein
MAVATMNDISCMEMAAVIPTLSAMESAATVLQGTFLNNGRRWPPVATLSFTAKNCFPSYHLLLFPLQSGNISAAVKPTLSAPCHLSLLSQRVV